jgi:penicillin amidase/acyl-homoserine-lactone acylase
MFALEANPDNPNQYKYDGEWRDLERATAKIKVAKPGAEPETFEREMLWSVQGPVVRRTDGLFAIRFAGYGEVKQLEQWYRMNKAQNLEEFRSAMEMTALPSLNTLYADKGGNLFYVYGGRIPVRAEGFDWTGAVPGNISKTLWSEVYPLSGLPQVLNPASGFIQSCNSTPFGATVGEGNPDPASFSKDMGIERQDTNRSRRARDLYGNDTSITREEFYAYKHDTKALPGADVTFFLEKKLFPCEIPDEPVLKEAITLLKGWDGSFTRNNRAAALAYLVGWPHGQREGWFGTPPSPVNVLRRATEVLKKTYGRLDPEWQEVLRLRHGKVDEPLEGGPDCLRAVYSELGPDGHLVGMAGDCYYQMVEWDKNGEMKSESISPYGAATVDENSPHYADQGPLFAKEQLRPTMMTETDVRKHLEREYRPGEVADPWYSK